MRTLLSLSATLSIAATAAAFPTYVVTEIADLAGGADASYATDMDDAGHVIANGSTVAGDRAFVWSRAGGHVPLPGIPGFGQTLAFTVNELGVVSGAAHNGVWPTGYRPVLWDLSGNVTELPLPAGVDWALQGQLSDQGTLVTWGGTTAGRRALIWKKATGWQVIAPPSGATECGFSSVNNKGDICGWADDKAMLYRNGVWSELSLPLGSLDAFPNVITDEGRVGGYVRTGPSSWIAGQWNLDGEFLQSPQLPGYPSMDCLTASPEGGLIAGAAYDDDFVKATLWSPVDGVVDLNTLVDPTTPGWDLQVALIKPRGTLVGWGVIGGSDRGFAAVPVGTPGSMNVVFGKHTAGNLENLRIADGNAVEVCKFIVPNQSVSPVTVEFDAASAIKSPFAYRLRATTSTSLAGSFQQVLDLFDWQASAYSPADTRTDSLGTAWKTVELNATGSIARYVGPGRTMRARVRVKPNGPVSGSAWCVRFDRLEFVVQL